MFLYKQELIVEIISSKNLKNCVSTIKKSNLISVDSPSVSQKTVCACHTPISTNVFNNMLNTIKEHILLAKYNIKNFLYNDTPDMLYSKSRVGKPAKTLIAQVIKPVMKKFINKDVNPAELDRRLTKLAGKGNVIEEPFIPSPKIGITKGRKKIFILPSGTRLELECHDRVKDGVTTYVTRLSDTTAEKNRRSYLAYNGDLLEDTYRKSYTHLSSGQLGLDWIDKLKKNK